MTKAYLVAFIDYEEFEPIAIYLDKNQADSREKEEQKIINDSREALKEERKRTGEYYPDTWKGPHYSSSVGTYTYEVDFID